MRVIVSQGLRERERKSRVVASLWSSCQPRLK
jgi:hypothetical protein